MKLLIIDNYDSFTFNLYQNIGELLMTTDPAATIDVIRNDALTVPEIMGRNYSHIIVSPGPGSPDDPGYFGVCAEVITRLGKRTPVLGVCLGMQGIAHCFGGKVVRAKRPMHGKTSLIRHDAQGVFGGIAQNVEVMRYHSLAVDQESLPPELAVTATAADDREVMGIRHLQYPIEGVQFHPESFATEAGTQLLRNFLLCGTGFP